MIHFAIDSENKTIELLSGGTVSELKDLCKKYKDYYFTVSFSRENKLEKQGMTVGSAYVPITSTKDYN
jgi:non-ribosomal peptide synthetase component E (peptide arylation enzyme)